MPRASGSDADPRDAVRVLIDARQGEQPTGIGRYVLSLLTEFGRIAPRDVRPLGWRTQRRALRDTGLRPWTLPTSHFYRPRLLPPATVTHGPNFALVDHMRAARVVTVHDLAFRHFPDRYPSAVVEELDSHVRRAAREAAVVICDSRATRDDLIEMYDVDAQRLQVVPLGVDASFFERPSLEEIADRRRALGLRRPFLLHVGALVPRKDVGTLLEAFRRSRAATEGHDVVLAGGRARDWKSDEDKIDLFRAKHPRLAERVRVLDYVDDRTLLTLHAAAAVYVTTSLCEGFGLTVLQGMAAGRPVVVTHSSSLPEVGGHHAFYGCPQDPDSFALAIDDALDAGEDSLRLAAARDHAASFSWRRTAELTLGAYRQAAGVGAAS